MQRVQAFESTDSGGQRAGEIVVVNRELHNVSINVSCHAVPLADRAITAPKVTLDPIGSAERVVKLDERLPFTLAHRGIARFWQGLRSSRFLRENSCAAKSQQ